MHKQQNNINTSAQLLAHAARKRKNNTVHAEISRLYDKNKNSYSKKFQMRLQLLNEPPKPLNKSFESTTSLGRRTNSKSRSKSKSKSKQSIGEYSQITMKASPTSMQSVNRVLSPNVIYDKHREEEHDKQNELNSTQKSTFIRIEGQQNYLQDVNTKENLLEHYRDIIRKIEKVKENCQSEQAKVKNAQYTLKSKRKQLIQERKGMRNADKFPLDTNELQRQLRQEKTKIYDMVEQHQKNMNIIKTALARLESVKQIHRDKLDFIEKSRQKDAEKQIQYDEQRREIRELKAQYANLLQQKVSVEDELTRLQKQLNDIKNNSIPPTDLHKKHLERIERAMIMVDMDVVNGYLKMKDNQKNEKKEMQRLKEILSKKKDELQQTKKKVEEKTKFSTKLNKQMNEKVALVMELNDKFHQYDRPNK